MKMKLDYMRDIQSNRENKLQNIPLKRDKRILHKENYEQQIAEKISEISLKPQKLNRNIVMM